MNNFKIEEKTISSLEVAGMMEIEHWKLLRKLDGDKKSSGIIRIMTDNNFVVSDFFKPSTYKDASGKENKCYEITKLGCDFLANKSTGEKGVLFTARYVHRFREMEDQIVKAPLTDRPGEIAKLINALSSVMQKNDSAPVDVARNAQLICEQYGIRLIDGFVRVPNYEQIGLLQG